MTTFGDGRDLQQDLARWSGALAAIARTGLGFTQSLYERERFEEVLHVAADIKAAMHATIDLPDLAIEPHDLAHEWMASVGEGIPGYVTPKVAIGIVVTNDDGEILLVQRADSLIWLYPTGWADVGYSPAEVAVKEVLEETGIECEPVRLLGVIDGQRMGFTRFGMYLLLFHARATGGTLQAHPLETAGVGWFSLDSLPKPSPGAHWWAPMAAQALADDKLPPFFDQPRSPMWRKPTNDD